LLTSAKLQEAVEGPIFMIGDILNLRQGEGQNGQLLIAILTILCVAILVTMTQAAQRRIGRMLLWTADDAQDDCYNDCSTILRNIGQAFLHHEESRSNMDIDGQEHGTGI
jgi:hypothetical protein